VEMVVGLVSDDLVAGIHDVADGGLAAALAEMVFSSGVGFSVSGIAGHAELFSESPSRVVVCVESGSVERVEARAADALVIKLIKCGGLRAAEHLAAVAGAVGMPVVVVSPFETHVGAAAGVHLALTLRPSPFAQELSIFTVEPRGPHTASAIQTNGDRILPPTAPGLGVTFE